MEESDLSRLQLSGVKSEHLGEGSAVPLKSRGGGESKKAGVERIRASRGQN